jgi:hypothetical protein
MGIFIIIEVSEKSPYGDYIGIFIKVSAFEQVKLITGEKKSKERDTNCL